MGGSKQYLETGGFKNQTFETVGITDGGIKVLKEIDSNSAKLPQYSNTPGTKYGLMRPDGMPKQIMYYSVNRKQDKRIDLDHDHPPQKGFHVQFFDGRKTRYELSSSELRDVQDLIKYYRSRKK